MRFSQGTNGSPVPPATALSASNAVAPVTRASHVPRPKGSSEKEEEARTFPLSRKTATPSAGPRGIPKGALAVEKSSKRMEDVTMWLVRRAITSFVGGVWPQPQKDLTTAGVRRLLP